MLAVEYLVKLYSVPADYGYVSAFDSYANTLFLGTHRGYILKLVVEGLPEYGGATSPSSQGNELSDLKGHAELNSLSPCRSGTPQCRTSSGLSTTHSKISQERFHVQDEPQQQEQPVQIFTRLAATAKVCAEDCEIRQLQHSRTQRLLFVLARGRVSVWNAVSLVKLGDVASDVSRFALSFPSATTSFDNATGQSSGAAQGSSTGPASPVAMAWTQSSQPHDRDCNLSLPLPPHTRTTSSITTTTSDSIFSTWQQQQRYRPQQSMSQLLLCVTATDARILNLFEVEVLADHRPRVVLSQELGAPAPVETLVVSEDMACVRMRQDCCFLSLTDGSSQSVLHSWDPIPPLPSPPTASGASSRNATLSHIPALVLALGEGEVYTCQGREVVAAPLAPLPITTPDAGSRSLCVLEDTARLIVARFPFLFIFTSAYCDVYSLYEDIVVERLPISGVLYGPQRARGDSLFVCGQDTVWMSRLRPLRQHLADLVEFDRATEAFELLRFHQARSALFLGNLEGELRLMAGFASLHRCQFADAFRYFGDRVDPRDLALCVPECVPPAETAEYSLEFHALLDTALAEGTSGQRVAISVVPCTDSSRTSGEGGSSDSASEAALCFPARQRYWHDWQGPSPYNLFYGELQHAWQDTFDNTDAFPFVPSSLFLEKHQGGPVRSVQDLGSATVAVFLEHCWTTFKDALWLFFHRRLADTLASIDKKLYSDDATEQEDGERRTRTERRRIAHARAMQYALLVLALERQEHRVAYDLVARGRYVCLEDCYDLLLFRVKEYRLLALLLWRHGRIAEAMALLREKVYISSYLPLPRVESPLVSPSLPTDVECCCSGSDAGEENERSCACMKAAHQVRRLVTTATRQWFRLGSGCAAEAPMAGRALLLLPQSARSVVVEHLLRVHIEPVKATVAERETRTEAAAALTATAGEVRVWLERVAEAYAMLASDEAAYPVHMNVTTRTLTRDEMTEVDRSRTALFTRALCIPHFGPIYCTTTGASEAKLPSSLAEAPYLLEKMNLPALRELLMEWPSAAILRDEEGSTLLHQAMSLLTLYDSASCDSSDSRDNGVVLQREKDKGSNSSIISLTTRELAFVHVVLSCIWMLVSADCDPGVINAHGLSCLDVAALISNGLYLDVSLSTLLAAMEVRCVSLRATSMNVVGGA